MWQIKLILTFPALFLFVIGVKANHIDGLTIDISSGMDDEETYFVDNFDYSINEDSLRSNFNLSIRQKKYREAIAFGVKYAEYVKVSNGSENTEYATILNNIAYCCNKIGDYDEACKYSEHCLKIREIILGKQSRLYTQTLQNLYTYCFNAGNYHKAISVAQEELKNDSIILGNNHQRIGELHHNIAVCYMNIKEYGKAEQYGLMSLHHKQVCLQQSINSVINTLSLLGSCYNKQNKWGEAIRYTEMAINYYNEDSNKDARRLTTLMNNMANYYSYLGQYKKAIEYGNLALNNEIKLGISPELIKCLSNTSLYYSYSKEYDNAVILLEKAKEIGEGLWGENAAEMATIYGNLSFCYLDLGLDSLAYTNSDKAIQIEMDSISHAIHLIQHANLLIYLKRYRDAIDSLNNAISMLGPASETDFLNCCQAYYYLGQCYYEIGEMEKAETFFNKVLDISSWINRNLGMLDIKGREDFIDRWGHLLNEIPYYLIEDDSKEMRSIAYNAILASKGILLSPQDSICKWEDIQRKLAPNEMAIEYIRMSKDNGYNIYGALIVKKDLDSPFFTLISDESQLSNTLFVNDISQMYQIVYNPLETFLDGIETIYFSPTGILNDCPIENITEHYQVLRLSSTRIIAEMNTKTKTDLKRNYILFGGIQYDLQEQRNMPFLANISNGTQMEINSIVKYLNKYNIPSKSYCGIVDESTFKKLSSLPFTNLHVATHGFYWNDSTFLRKKHLARRIIKLNENPSYEELVLHRCGLLFSGSAESLSEYGNDICHDGILTGYDISQLNLSMVDLVTLSACQTGLGDNIMDEGTYGLQRAFKRAGVHSILMTLWNTDDISTRLFMQEFYRNYIGGMSKTESLKAAQMYLRSYKDKYGNLLFDNPIYWAGFVLLDAIN